MSLDFEDRILGEKVDYYCDSDNDERAEDNEENASNDGGDGDDSSRVRVGQFSSKSWQREDGGMSNPSVPPQLPPRPGAQTGPKGVLEDYRQYKQMEKEKQIFLEQEKIALAKRVAMTCNSRREDEILDTAKEDWERELEEMMDSDQFMEEYRQRRFQEMLKQSENMVSFGKVFELDVNSFLTSVDNEAADIHVIVHVYEPHVSACDATHGCFLSLCRQYPGVKFCRITATQANLSANFSENGVPALLLFKGGNQVGNLVAINRILGEDFFAPELEALLIKNGFLLLSQKRHETTTVPSHSKEDSDSDYDVD